MKTVDGCCPDRGGSKFFTDEEKKDFKIESKDRNTPSGRCQSAKHACCPLPSQDFTSMKKYIFISKRLLKYNSEQIHQAHFQRSV